MTDVLLRSDARGIRVAEPFPRLRRGKPAIGTTRISYYANATDAALAALTRLTGETPDLPTESTESPVAHARETTMNVDSLKPQARQILHHLILRRGLTAQVAMNITPPCYRLAGRVHEIREVFGADSVETIYRTAGGSRFAEYRWRGPDSIQLDLSA